MGGDGVRRRKYFWGKLRKDKVSLGGGREKTEKAGLIFKRDLELKSGTFHAHPLWDTGGEARGSRDKIPTQGGDLKFKEKRNRWKWGTFQLQLFLTACSIGGAG